MPAGISTLISSLDLAAQREIHQACTLFETQVQRGEKPSVEAFIEGKTGLLRSALLRELLHLEIAYRDAEGPALSVDSLLARFAADEPLVRQVYDEAHSCPAAGQELDGPAEAERFEVVDFLSQGGLGKISRGIDRQFNREVALKEIQPRFAGCPEHQQRFDLEARVTACLEHPGVVPIHGWGRHRDGRPFYAMRMIHGQTLRDAIQRLHSEAQGPAPPAMELRRLLTRFLSVCHTMEYAHSRGVLHCDLKPANIMLGPYGETLIVDWGLAQVESDVPRALMRHELAGIQKLEPSTAQAGTPAYMSPEQTAAGGGLLGPATDVYGLGATLYCLLTGQPPVTATDPSEVVERVRLGDIPPPRSIAPWVPAPLNAIVLKAMSRRPGDRYPAAVGLAEDLERWLADEPTTAYREPVRVRASRWARRHRTWVATAVAASLVAVLGLVTIILLQRGATRRIDAQRIAALENLRLARAAVDDLHVRISSVDLVDVPGLQPLRRELLQRALRYNQEFSQRVESHPGLRRELTGELANTHQRLSELLGELGPLQEAADHAQRAVALYQEIASEREDRSSKAALAASWHGLGKLDILRNRFPDAKRSLHQAWAIQSRLVQEEGSAALRNQFAATLGQLAYVEWNSDPRRALELYREGAAIREELVRQHPGDTTYLFDLTRILNNVGLLQRELGDHGGALQTYLRARQLQETSMRLDPARLSFQVDYASTSANLGALYLALGELQRAEECYAQAVATLRELATQNPTVPRYQLLLARADNQLAAALANSGRFDEARRIWCRNLETLESLQREVPDLTEVRRDLVETYNAQGKHYRETGALDEARESLTAARRLAEPLVQNDPTDAYARESLAYVLNGLALIEQQQQRLPESRVLLEAAIGHLREIVARAATADREATLSNTLWALGEVLRQSGDYPEAARVAADRQALWGDRASEHFFAACELARCAAGAADAAQVENYIQRAIDALERAVALGYAELDSLRTNSDLDLLRPHPRFRQLMDRVSMGPAGP